MIRQGCGLILVIFIFSILGYFVFQMIKVDPQAKNLKNLNQSIELIIPRQKEVKTSTKRLNQTSTKYEKSKFIWIAKIEAMDKKSLPNEEILIAKVDERVLPGSDIYCKKISITKLNGNVWEGEFSDILISWNSYSKILKLRLFGGSIKDLDWNQVRTIRLIE